MHANIEITRNCNQKCFYCFNDSGPSHKKAELDLFEWMKILSKLQSFGCNSILVTGGEPFMHPDILEILKYCIGLGFETSILSNGYKIAAFVEAHPVLFSKIRLAQISLDTMDAEVYNARRGYTGAFNDAIDAINALRTVHVPIEISTVFSDQTLSQIIDLAKYCESIDAALIIRELISTGRYKIINRKIASNTSKGCLLKELYLHTGVNIVSDRYDYVGCDDKYVKRYDHITIEASGNIKNCDMSIYARRDFFREIKVA